MKTSTAIACALVVMIAFAGCAKRLATADAVVPAPAARASVPGATPGDGGRSAVQPGQPLAPGQPLPGGETRISPQPGGTDQTGGATRPDLIGARPAPTPGPTGQPGGAAAQPGGGGALIPGDGATPRVREGDYRVVAALRNIHFGYDSSEIRPEDARILEENARWLKANANALVLIEGHCDERGTDQYNVALGERRAMAALQYLVAQGVSVQRFSTISYGSERRTCAEHTEACWAAQRRAQFMVRTR
jgi:peptidoglycan-associated lipoprotein